MVTEIRQPPPAAYAAIDNRTKALGFGMSSDVQTCSLLRTLAASKPAGKMLELGTGTGLSTAWILDGMDDRSSLISIDNDPVYLAIAKESLLIDGRLELLEADGGEWIAANKNQCFDFIFADTWHGKYLLLEDTLSMLNKGGLYIIDDILPQPNWPEGHDQKALNLVTVLESRTDLLLTKMNWATGIVVAVKK